jgi:hypothetical protein
MAGHESVFAFGMATEVSNMESGTEFLSLSE